MYRESDDVESRRIARIGRFIYVYLGVVFAELREEILGHGCSCQKWLSCGFSFYKPIPPNAMIVKKQPETGISGEQIIGEFIMISSNNAHGFVNSRKAYRVKRRTGRNNIKASGSARTLIPMSSVPSKSQTIDKIVQFASS